MLYNIINQKNGESCQVEAPNVSVAMFKARRQMKWTNYGNRMVDGVLSYRNYVISKVSDVSST